MLLVRIICGPFILMVVLSDMVLPQRQPAIRLDFSRTVGENQITLRCRWSGNFSNVQDPHLFVNSTNTPVQFERLEDGVLEYNISQELEGYYYCGASPNNIDSNSVTLIAYPQPRSSIPTQRSVEVGQTITVDCPIAVGALRELYTFIWRKGQTLDTTRPGTPYSVDPLNKSLTIVNVQLDNNGTYYCDVVISVPGVNPYFVPEEYTKISLFVTERQPMPSTTTSTLKPYLPDRTDTLIPLSTFVKGISTGSPPGGSPSMTPSPTGQRTTMPPMESLDVIIVLLPIIGVLVLVLLILAVLVGCVCLIRNKAGQKKEVPEETSGEQPTEQPNSGGESICNQNGTLDPKVPKLDSGKRTPEYSVFLENYDKLSRTLSRLVAPNDLANRLFANKLIGDDLKEQANNVYVDKAVRIDKLLAAVLNQIDLNCTVYQKFIEILQDYKQLKDLLRTLENKPAENRRIAADGGSDDEDGTDDGDGDDDDEDYEGAKEAVWMVTSL